MAQAAASNFRRFILGTRQESTSISPSVQAAQTVVEVPPPLPTPINFSAAAANTSPNAYSYHHRPVARVDRRNVEKVWKQMDRIVKYCQMPKMNLKNSPPYMLDILPDLYQTLREIMNNYDDRLHILNDIDYFRLFMDNLIDQCSRTIDCFKRAGHHMYDEQSSDRKTLTKLSLYFSHILAELKSLFIGGLYEGERFRFTKQEANDFWKNNFNARTIVPWDEFKEKLSRVHPIQTVNETNALQNTIDLTNNNHVSVFEFDVFTRLFHPWSSLLTNWKLLAVTHPGFMAFMTYDEVKAILTDCIDKPGSYVFRLSCTRLGQWAIGYVTTQNTILQTIPQTKPLIQSLIDGEREGYYKYPNGKNVTIDLSSALRPAEADCIHVSEEQYAIYCDMGTCFELCKICSVNNKDSKIQPCGHLLCQNCLNSWQNQSSAKPPPLCPFCRGEIKGFESVVINPFDSIVVQNRKENISNEPNEFDDVKLDANPNVQDLQMLAIARPIGNGHSSQPTGAGAAAAAAVISRDSISPTPPPIPPRPVNAKILANRSSLESASKTNITQRFQQSVPPPLPRPPSRNNDGLIHPRQTTRFQHPSSSASSSESLNDSLAQLSTASRDSAYVRPPALQNGSTQPASTTSETAVMDNFQTIDDVRRRLDENHFDSNQIQTALNLTQGLPLMKQYDMVHMFLSQIQQAQREDRSNNLLLTNNASNNNNNTFVNGSFVTEFD